MSLNSDYYPTYREESESTPTPASRSPSPEPYSAFQDTQAALASPEPQSQSNNEGDVLVRNNCTSCDSHHQATEVYKASLRTTTEYNKSLEHKCTKLRQMLLASQDETVSATSQLHRLRDEQLMSRGRSQRATHSPSAKRKCDQCLSSDAKEIKYLEHIAQRAVARADRLEVDVNAGQTVITNAHNFIEALTTQNTISEQRDILSLTMLRSRDRRINHLKTQVSHSANELEKLEEAKEAGERRLLATIADKEAQIEDLKAELENRKARDTGRRACIKLLLERLSEAEGFSTAVPASSDEPSAKRRRLD